jgi:hypothetical protein
MMRPAPAAFSPRRELENLSIGMGRGTVTGMEGTKQLLTQPVATAQALIEAARQLGTDPAVILDMLRAARQKAMLGSLGLGELIGENVTPGMRWRGAPMAQMTELPRSRLPRVDEIEGINVGPGGKIKPRVIAEGRPLYRETSALNANDYLRDDRNFYYGGGFVTDDPDLAIGQAINKGVMLQFRPNAVSGEMHYKPGTGVIGGNEYRADIMAPRAIEKVIIKKPKDVKNLTWLARKNLAENFTKSVNPDGSIVYTRKVED